MNIRFTQRSLSGNMFLPGLRFEVERLGWSTVGGPESADVFVRGPLSPSGSPWGNRVGLVVQLLRCGVVISDESGGAAWWGFVNAVELILSDGHVLTISLDEMANRVAVRYRDERISPEVNQGWQFQTAWAQDNNSVSEWGKKERIFTQVPATPTEANNLRATMLEKHKRPMLRATSPQPSPTPSPLGEGWGEVGFARLRLRGWWDTLNWTYFTEPRGYVGFAGGGAIQSFGDVAATARVAQSFSVNPGWTAYTVWFKVAKFGAPGDNLTAYLRVDSAGAPGVSVATATVAGSSLGGDLAWVRFDFGSAYGMAASTTYWLDLARSGGLDANNYYRVSMDDGLPFVGGVGRIWNGGAWVARTPDADVVFQLTGQEVTTEQIKTMGDPANGCAQFLKGVWIQTASGIAGRQYRDGRSLTGDEIQALLEQGTSSAGPLMATVTAERWLIVQAVPAASSGSAAAELGLLASGELRTRSGGVLPAGFNPVGKWARVAGLDQMGGDRNAPGCVLVTRAEWSGGRMRLAWKSPGRG